LSALGGREIRVRAGDPLKIDVPISGAPTPTVAWQKDGKELENSPRVCSHFTRKILSFRKPFIQSRRRTPAAANGYSQFLGLTVKILNAYFVLLKVVSTAVLICVCSKQEAASVGL